LDEKQAGMLILCVHTRGEMGGRDTLKWRGYRGGKKTEALPVKEAPQKKNLIFNQMSIAI
jgi:hypothetical protein